MANEENPFNMDFCPKDECAYVPTSYKDLQAHLRLWHYGDKSRVCRKCGAHYKRMDRLIRHLYKEHDITVGKRIRKNSAATIASTKPPSSASAIVDAPSDAFTTSNLTAGSILNYGDNVVVNESQFEPMNVQECASNEDDPSPSTVVCVKAVTDFMLPLMSEKSIPPKDMDFVVEGVNCLCKLLRDVPDETIDRLFLPFSTESRREDLMNRITADVPCKKRRNKVE